MITFTHPENNQVALPIIETDIVTVFGVYSTWDDFLNGTPPLSTVNFNGQHNYLSAENFFSSWTKVCRDNNEWAVIECEPTDQPEVPKTISARQIRLWLLSSGIFLTQIDTLIDNIDDPQQRDVTRVEWEYAPYIERNHPMVAVFAEALGLSSAAVDQAFILAATL
jgi:hypothetical protein